MKRLIFLAVIAAHASAQSIDPDNIPIGSEAVLWGQRAPVEKLAYLEGFCQGLRAHPSKLSMSWCIGDFPSRADIAAKPLVKRFCALLNLQPQKAVSYFDSFYKVRKQSDIPNWAAAAAYNDKACGENEVTSSLTRMQMRNECYRSLANMPITVAEGARKLQEEHCKSLPR